MVREVTRPDGSVHRLSAPVLLGQKEMSRFTLRSALKLLEINEEEFEGAVR